MSQLINLFLTCFDLIYVILDQGRWNRFDLGLLMVEKKLNTIVITQSSISPCLNPLHFPSAAFSLAVAQSLTLSCPLSYSLIAMEQLKIAVLGKVGQLLCIYVRLRAICYFV